MHIVKGTGASSISKVGSIQVLHWTTYTNIPLDTVGMINDLNKKIKEKMKLNKKKHMRVLE